MSRPCQPLGLLAAAGLGLCLAGCDGKYQRLPESGATLEGTVTYGNEKVTVAMVIAQGDSGAATAFVGDDGRYHLDNVPLGEVNIAVNTEAGKGQLKSKLMAESRGRGGRMPKLIDVPARYADPPKSGIKTTIEKGENTFDIVIPK